MSAIMSATRPPEAPRDSPSVIERNGRQTLDLCVCFTAGLADPPGLPHVRVDRESDEAAALRLAALMAISRGRFYQLTGVFQMNGRGCQSGWQSIGIGHSRVVGGGAGGGGAGRRGHPRAAG